MAIERPAFESQRDSLEDDATYLGHGDRVIGWADFLRRWHRDFLAFEQGEITAARSLGSAPIMTGWGWELERPPGPGGPPRGRPNRFIVFDGKIGRLRLQ